MVVSEKSCIFAVEIITKKFNIKTLKVMKTIKNIIQSDLFIITLFCVGFALCAFFYTPTTICSF